MAFALLFKKDGSGRSIVPINNESAEELGMAYKGHFEGRFDTHEAAEAEKKRLDEKENEGGWQ